MSLRLCRIVETMSLHNFTDECATIDWMNVLGEGVVKANEVIDSDADPKYVAAARAVRAYFTYLEMDNFGDAPIVDKAYCEKNGVDITARQPRADVAKWIESELLAVADQLPEETMASRISIWHTVFWLACISTGLFIQQLPLINMMQPITAMKS